MEWYLWLLLIGVVVAVLYFIVKRLYGTQLKLLEWLTNPLGAITHV